jgi:hypothetical protein
MKDIFEGAGRPLEQSGFDRAVGEVGGDDESLWSILRVETKGFGFFADRRPKILFERHVFRGRTGGQFDLSAPDLSNSQPGGYAGGPDEYTRLKRAMLLDRSAALESVSWGLGQVMGVNAVKIGYASVDAMVTAFSADEASQIMGCVRFIQATPALTKAYLARQWDKVAFFYNGKNYAINNCDVKLEAAYREFGSKGCASIGLRAVQAYLTYLGFDPKGVDGLPGRNTDAALAAFRARYTARAGLPTLPDPDAPAEAHLGCLSAAFEAAAST